MYSAVSNTGLEAIDWSEGTDRRYLLALRFPIALSLSRSPLEKEPSQAAKGVPLFGDQPRLGVNLSILQLSLRRT